MFMTTTQSGRYSSVAIALHWLIALLMLGLLASGWWMTAAIDDRDRQALAYRTYQVHKAVGFLVLALTLARLAWRLGHPIPPLPAAMASWERFAARSVHAAFYVLLLALPASGWVYVSSGWAVSTDQPLNVATSWFGLFQVPHLPFVAGQPDDQRRALGFMAMGAHELLAWGAAALAGVHMAAALKHHFLDRDEVLRTMVPWLRVGGSSDEPGRRGRPLAPWLAGGAAALGLGLIGVLANPPPARQDHVQGGSAARPALSPAAEEAIGAGRAAAWTLDRARSKIAFAGTHAGAGFGGEFTDWEGHIWFDPADLEGSRIVVLVRTGSAKTGDASQEASLAESEWFNPKAFPTARFETTSIRALSPTRYEASGALQIKDRKVKLVLPFTLRIEGDRASAEGSVDLDRTAFDLGMFSDPSSSWVSKQIRVEFAVQAKRSAAAPAAVN